MKNTNKSDAYCSLRPDNIKAPRQEKKTLKSSVIYNGKDLRVKDGKER